MAGAVNTGRRSSSRSDPVSATNLRCPSGSGGRRVDHVGITGDRAPDVARELDGEPPIEHSREGFHHENACDGGTRFELGAVRKAGVADIQDEHLVNMKRHAPQSTAILRRTAGS